MHERRGIDGDRVATVRYFTRVPPDATPEVSNYGLRVGHLSKEKGVGDLLTALHVAGDPPFRIAGGGPVAEQLRVLAVERGLRRVEFLGFSIVVSAVSP